MESEVHAKRISVALLSTAADRRSNPSQEREIRLSQKPHGCLCGWRRVFPVRLCLCLWRQSVLRRRRDMHQHRQSLHWIKDVCLTQPPRDKLSDILLPVCGKPAFIDVTDLLFPCHHLLHAGTARKHHCITSCLLDRVNSLTKLPAAELTNT